MAASSARDRPRTGSCADRIVFGQSAALTGPAEELGLEMRRGIMAAFAEANADGGVEGRTLDLVARDDVYEPEAAIANTTALIREDKVFALIGEVGTPTSAAAEPIARAAGVPFIAPFTGAELLRDPALTMSSTSAPPTSRRPRRSSSGCSPTAASAGSRCSTRTIPMGGAGWPA